MPHSSSMYSPTRSDAASASLKALSSKAFGSVRSMSAKLSRASIIVSQSSAISAGGSSSSIAAIASSNSAGVLGSMLLKRSSISRAASQDDSALALASSSPQAARPSASAGTARAASRRRAVGVERVACIDGLSVLARSVVSRAPDHGSGDGVMGGFPGVVRPGSGGWSPGGRPGPAHASRAPARAASACRRPAVPLPAGRSAPVPGGEALDVRGEVGGEDHLAPQAVLVGEGLGEAEAQAVVDRPPVADDTPPGERGDLPGQLDRRLQCRAGGHETVDEPDALRLRGVDLAPGEDEVERPP